MIKKIFIIYLIGFLSLGIFVMPKKAEAIFGVGDTTFAFETNPALIGAATGSAASNATLTTETITRNLAKIVMEGVKRRILNMVVDQIIGWIQGEGKPLFITDWQAFLKDAGSAAVGDLAYQLGLGFLCSPFSVQVQLSILQPPRFGSYITCTLEDIVNNMDNFYADFRTGGWFALNEMWNPQNNFYGSVLLAMNEKNQRRAGASEASILESVASQGFLGTRKCDETGQYCFITTPGAQIGALAAKALGSDIDYLVNAQDIAVYVGAIADAAINRLIKEGVNGLLGVTTKNKPDGGYVSDSGFCAGLSGQAYSSCLATGTFENMDFNTAQKNYLKEITQNQLPRIAAQQFINLATPEQEKLVNALTGLLACQTARVVPEAAATQAELEKEEPLLRQLKADQEDNRQIIYDLDQAKNRIFKPEERQVEILISAYNDVNGILDLEASSQFKTDYEKTSQEVIANTKVRLPIVTTALNACGPQYINNTQTQ